MARTSAMAAWGPAEEWARRKFTGAHLHYCLTELAKAKNAAENSDPARAALDAAKAAAAA